MGYNIWYIDSEFTIPEENLEKAINCFKNVAEYRDIKNFQDIEEIFFQELGISFTWDIKHYVNGIEWEEGFNTNREYENLFTLIAPYVKEGSYIIVQGDDCTYWKWLFRNNKFIEIEGEVIFKHD